MAALGGLSLRAAPAAPIYLGVLEARAEEQTWRKEPFGIRVPFEYRSGVWRAMPHEADNLEALGKLHVQYPATLQFTMTLEGRRVGAVGALRPEQFDRYAEQGVYRVPASSSVPKFRAGAESFATEVGYAPYRPLVLTTGSQFVARDEWTVGGISYRPADLERMGQVMLAQFPQLARSCNLPQEKAEPGKMLAASQPGFQNRHGIRLAHMQADPAEIAWCGEEEGEESITVAMESAWFILEHDQARWIGEGLTFLDAADYDGDGHDEVVFCHSAYNRGGYLLLHDRLRKMSRFTWSYH